MVSAAPRPGRRCIAQSVRRPPNCLDKIRLRSLRGPVCRGGMRTARACSPAGRISRFRRIQQPIAMSRSGSSNRIWSRHRRHLPGQKVPRVDQCKKDFADMNKKTLIIDDPTKFKKVKLEVGRHIVKRPPGPVHATIYAAGDPIFQRYAIEWVRKMKIRFQLPLWRPFWISWNLIQTTRSYRLHSLVMDIRADSFSSAPMAEKPFPWMHPILLTILRTYLHCQEMLHRP